MERLVELGRPVVGLGLGGVLASLIGQMRSDQVDLDKRPEHAGLCRPPDVVSRNHCGGGGTRGELEYGRREIDGRRERGDRRWETRDGGQKMGYVRWEMGYWRRETGRGGGRRQGIGDGRWETNGRHEGIYRVRRGGSSAMR